MNEKKNATACFTLEAVPSVPFTAAQVQAMHQRLMRADAKVIDYSDTPELSDEWFLRAAREGRLATPPVKKTYQHQT